MAVGEAHDERERLVHRLGLCALCSFQRTVVSDRGSTFSLCRNPALPKYPAVPVLRCSGFEHRPAEVSRAGSCARC